MDPAAERTPAMSEPFRPEDDHSAASIALPPRPRLPTDRAPTWDELRAVAAHYAIGAHVAHYRELCASLFEWITVTDEQRWGLALADIVSGFADGRFDTPDGGGESLLRRALSQLTDVREPLLDRADGERWRALEPSPIAGMDTNAGYLLKAALVDGWDVIVPGTGYDGDAGSPPVRELIIMSGPTGQLTPPLRVTARGRSEVGDEPTLAFTFIFDPKDEVSIEPGAVVMFEGRFACDYGAEEPYSGFETFPVLPESGWGSGPDFRETTHGWASWGVWGENDLVVAWARPGDTVRGCWRGSFEVDEGWPYDQHFWLALARAAVRAETETG